MASNRLLLSALSIAAIYILSDAQKYILVKEIKTVDDAEIYCQQHYGTSLASIHSHSDNIEANQLCSSDHNCLNGANCKAACSIGANDKQNERWSNHDGWVWNDGTPFNYWNWAAGEPNQWHLFPNGENCVIIWANNHPNHGFPGTWNDCPCDGSGDYVQRFLCNSPTLQPTNHPISTLNPSPTPTTNPTKNPTQNPTKSPTKDPTKNPTTNPTQNPTKPPINGPTNKPTSNPTLYPTKIPTIYPTFNPTAAPTGFKSVSSDDIVTTKTKLESNNYSKYEEHSHEHVYIIGGLIGGLVFLCLCFCCLLAVGLIYCWKRKRNVNDQTNGENISMASTIHHHHYHGSTQLTEDDNTTNPDHNGEGDDGKGRAGIGLTAEKEIIQLLPPDIVFSDDDEELDGMYIQSNPPKLATQKGASVEDDNVNKLLDVEEDQNIIPGDDIHTS